MVLNTEKIKQIIQDKQINVSRMAENIGISQSGFYRILQNGDCVLSTFILLCNFLEVSPVDLLTGFKAVASLHDNGPDMAIMRDLVECQKKVIELQDKVQELNKIEHL